MADPLDRPISALPPEAQVERIESYPDPLHRIAAADDAQELYAELSSRLRRVRQGAMRELVGLGWTYEQIAGEFLITRARVEQLVNDKRP